MFNLHSLRWVYDLIRPGEQGDAAALEAAADVWSWWDRSNPRRRSPHQGDCTTNRCGDWSPCLG